MRFDRQSRKAGCPIDDDLRTPPLLRPWCQDNPTVRDLRIKRIAGTNIQLSSHRAGKNDLSFGRDRGLHGKTILPQALSSCNQLRRRTHAQSEVSASSELGDFRCLNHSPAAPRLFECAKHRESILTKSAHFHLTLAVQDGRTLPSNYREFNHGYTITAHRSQGKTVDSVILSADAMKQELFYVAASRGRREIAIVTSDREQLRESLGISSARPSATELARDSARSLQLENGKQVASGQTLGPRLPHHEVSMSHGIGLSL